MFRRHAFIILFDYFLNLCNLCIAMNEAMLNETDVSLLEWSDLVKATYEATIANVWDRTYKKETVHTAEAEDTLKKERIPTET